MPRAEFPKSVKLAALARCMDKDGFPRCENCSKKIRPGNGPIFDHGTPDYVGGLNTLENCKVLCERPCNRAKTDKNDRPAIDKTRAVLEKRLGLRKTRRPLPGSRRSPFKQKLDGTWERRT